MCYIGIKFHNTYEDTNIIYVQVMGVAGVVIYKPNSGKGLYNVIQLLLHSYPGFAIFIGYNALINQTINSY